MKRPASAEAPPAKRPAAAEDASRAGLPVVLGTSSKWRRGVFAQHFPEYGSDFMAADIDEKAIRRPRPEEMTLAIAGAKADALLPRLAGREVLLVCMDQVVAVDGEVREKPESEAEARAYLASYQEGKGASCVNGMVVHNTRTGKRVTTNNVATAFWKAFPDSVVDALVLKGDIFTSAGGFTIEDPALAPHLDRIEGTEDAIQGLPVEPLRSLLLRAQTPDITHVIFDMDGLLLDTESAYTVVQQRILDRFGKTFTWELKSMQMGKKALESGQILIDELGLHGQITAEEFIAERERGLAEFFANVGCLPGVERLLRHLHRHGIPMAVATGSHKQAFEQKTLKTKDLFALMRHVVTGCQVSKGKPDPEIFHVAASRFEGGAPPSERVLVFEDAPNGVQAGRAAGMQVCHVPDRMLPHTLRGGSHLELVSLEDFKPEEWGLPAF